MEIQAWITISMFVAAIIFSIVMAAISPAFRNEWKLQNVFAYAIFFLMIVVAGLMLTVATHCSITGKEDYKWCGMYAWAMTILVVLLFGMFLAYNIILHKQEKDEQKADDDYLMPAFKGSVAAMTMPVLPEA